MNTETETQSTAARWIEASKVALYATIYALALAFSLPLKALGDKLSGLDSSSPADDWLLAAITWAGLFINPIFLISAFAGTYIGTFICAIRFGVDNVSSN